MVQETIVSYDEAARTLTYVGAGLPGFVEEARNRWQVIPVDDHRARVCVDATLELRGIIGPLLALPLRLRLAREGTKVLDDLKHYAEEGQPSPRKLRQLAKSSAKRAV